MTIHSSEGCNVTVGKYGQLGSSGSNVDCGYGGGYDGCTVFANTGKSYGSGFNSAGGGIYALHWTSTAIKVWLFPGASAPKDITTLGATPNPNGWGTPQASFAGCAFDQYFKNMNIVSVAPYRTCLSAVPVMLMLGNSDVRYHFLRWLGREAVDVQQRVLEAGVDMQCLRGGQSFGLHEQLLAN